MGSIPKCAFQIVFRDLQTVQLKFGKSISDGRWYYYAFVYCCDLEPLDLAPISNVYFFGAKDVYCHFLKIVYHVDNRRKSYVTRLEVVRPLADIVNY